MFFMYVTSYVSNSFGEGTLLINSIFSMLILCPVLLICCATLDDSNIQQRQHAMCSLNLVPIARFISSFQYKFYRNHHILTLSKYYRKTIKLFCRGFLMDLKLWHFLYSVYILKFLQVPDYIYRTVTSIHLFNKLQFFVKCHL